MALPDPDLIDAKVREAIYRALVDPTIFFVEEQDQAEDYWKRQRDRVMQALGFDGRDDAQDR